METTKKSSRKAGGMASAEKIESAYKHFLLTEGKQPASVYKFCIDLGITESEFYSKYASFDALDSQLWKEFINTTIQRLQRDKSFGTFSAREKILAFYYTLFEELKSNRSYVLFHVKPFKKPEITPAYLREFKKSFESFFESTLNQGKENGEVAARPYLDKRYPQLFWFHLGFILLFWKEDNSADFEKTDAAIEKSVALAFDLMGKGAIDTAIDFAKFIYQSKS